MYIKKVAENFKLAFSWEMYAIWSETYKKIGLCIFFLVKKQIAPQLYSKCWEIKGEEEWRERKDVGKLRGEEEEEMGGAYRLENNLNK